MTVIKKRLFHGIMGAMVFSALCAFPAFAKEERTPVGHIRLNISSDIQAGDAGASIDVSVKEGNCSLESADFINEQEYWAGGVRPKVEIWLAAGRGRHF